MFTSQIAYKKLSFIKPVKRVRITYPIQIETITQHQFPNTEWSRMKRFHGTHDSETELYER
jgi:hypothetical protein